MTYDTFAFTHLVAYMLTLNKENQSNKGIEKQNYALIMMV